MSCVLSLIFSTVYPAAPITIYDITFEFHTVTGKSFKFKSSKVIHFNHFLK